MTRATTYKTANIERGIDARPSKVAFEQTDRGRLWWMLDVRVSLGTARRGDGEALSTSTSMEALLIGLCLLITPTGSGWSLNCGWRLGLDVSS